MVIIEKSERYELCWVDSKETILQLSIEAGWTWQEALTILANMDMLIQENPKPVYSVYYFQAGASLIPADATIENLQRLIASEQENEALVIFVKSTSLLKTLISVIQKVTQRLDSQISKFHYVDTLEKAYQLIESHKHQT